MKNWQKFLISILICGGAALLGSAFIIPSLPTWYVTISKPAFTPPEWLFIPVWTLLYGLMGFSLYMIWNESSRNKNIKTAVYLFGIQLGLNVLWTFSFFTLLSPFLALVEIIMLLVMISLTILEFYSIKKNAGLLLIPYLGWTIFATILNYSIWIMNAF